MELREIDLNLLLVLAELHKQRSVSRVALSLGMSQPGVSNALKRMRHLLGDDLFVRTGRGMQPTPYADRIYEPLAAALESIHTALNVAMSFDAATSTRNFTIAMTDIGEIDFLPGLLASVKKKAPGVTLSTVRKTVDNLKGDLESGQVDLAVGLLPSLTTGVYKRRLAMSGYVCLFRRGHPLHKEKISVEEYCAAEHLVVVSPGTGHGVIDEDLPRLKVRRRVRLKIPHFAAIGHILRDSDLVATVPFRLVKRCVEPFGLAWSPAPVKLRAIGIDVFWAAKFDRDPGNRWLRDLMFELFHDT